MNNTPPDEPEQDLFGNPVPRRSWDVLIAEFIREVKTKGEASFNDFRHRNKIEDVPEHIGGEVRTACLRAGLVKGGTEIASLAKSRGRLCQCWRVPEGQR